MKSRPSLFLSRFQAACLLGLSLSASLHAANIVKLDNTTNLNSGTSWSGGTAPGSGDIATWDASILSGPNTTVLGADLSWAGIKITSPAGLVTVNSGNTLTLGTSGIDMSAATQDVTLNNAVTLGGAQTWKVDSGRTLTLGGTVARGSNSLTINGGVNGVGTVSMTGGLTGTGGLYVDGTLNYSATGGTTTDFRIGNGATGKFTISGGDLTVTGGLDVLMAQAGTNSTFTQTGGTLNLGGSFFKGANGATQTSSIDVSGGTWTQTGTFMTNQRGAGTLTVSSNANMSVGLLALGGWVGDSKTATINLNGGALSASAVSEQLTNPSQQGGNGGTTSTFNFNGGTLKPTANNTTFMTNVDNAVVKVGGALVDTNNFNITIAKALTHDSGGPAIDGGLTKNGAGTLTLSGANGYTGNTTVNLGTLLVNGVHTGSGTATVIAGTLGGSGTLPGAITVGDGTGGADSFITGGAVAGVGTLTTNSALSLSSDATFKFEFNSSGTPAADKLIANGVTLNAASVFSITDIAVTHTALGSGTFLIIDNTSANPISGTFAGLPEGSIVSDGFSNQFRVSYLGGTGGNDMTLTVVPEPGAWMSLLGGMGMLLGLRRRRTA